MENPQSEPVLLVEKAARFLRNAQVILAERGAVFQELRDLLQASLTGLKAPMRVALVGQIKTSKSTLVNALLGQEEVVRTGEMEETWNVSWLKHGDAGEPITVAFRGNRPPEQVPRSDWAAWANRMGGNLRDDVRYLEVRHPSDVLLRFDIIDTPGLGSSERIDSLNTTEFLKDVKPDAIVYLFNKNAHRNDLEVTESFQGPLGSATPLNAIGVLSMYDRFFWRTNDGFAADAFGDAKRVADRLASNPRVKSSLFRIYPLCARMALGAQVMDERDFKASWALSFVDKAVLESAFFNEGSFAKENSLFPVAACERARLAKRFTDYGVFFACEWLKQHRDAAPEMVREQLRRELKQRSGFADLCAIILSRFGNRSSLLKLYRIFSELREYRRRQENADPVLKEATIWLDHGVQDFLCKFDKLKELDALVCDCYEGKLELMAEEREQLLQLAGESGRSCAARLGFSNGPSIPSMIEAAESRIFAWNGLSHGRGAIDFAFRKAAKIIHDNYQMLREELQDAERILRGD